MIKHTAFEGLRFPLTTAYELLSTIVNTAYVDAEKKTISTGKKRKGPKLSVVDYILKWEAAGMEAEKVDAKLTTLMNSLRPSIRKLATDFNLEANTVAKFLEKISARIHRSETGVHGSNYERVVHFTENHYKRDFDFYLGMMMIPLVGKWEFGELQLGSKHYGICADTNNSWYVCRMLYKENDNGNYTVEYDNSDEVVYGTPEWAAIFSGRSSTCQSH